MNEERPDDYILLQRQGGVQVTVCRHRFEVIIDPGIDAKEQVLMGMLRDWVRERRAKEELRKPGDLSE